jgi:polar amino acid transport system substrate-binding protein
MKRIRLAIACVAVAAILPFYGSAHGAPPVPAPSGLKTSGTLTFGTNFGYPPMEMFGGSSANVATGADVDLARAMAAKMGLKAAFVNITDFGTIIVGLESHRYDAIISAMNITPARQKTLNFVAYFNAGQSIVVKKGNPLHIKTLADLSGQTVSIQSGTVEIDSANAENAILKKQGKPEIKIKSFSEDQVALQQITLGRVAAEITDYPVAVFDSTQFSKLYQIAGQQWGASPYGIAIRKSDPSILEAITSALKQIRSDGEYLTILKKYHLEQGALK